jgi:N-methylhydantoinase A
MPTMTNSRLRVASDVGGTFTDNLAYDAAERRITVAKVPTTPENRALGTVRGLRRALVEQGRGGGDVVYVGHGMTTATNALLQRSGARIAFITNEGFRDLLLIGRQNRPNLYDIRKTRPRPLVRREDCHTVRGRLDYAGNEIVPLDEAGVLHIAERLRADGVAAVAICFLHAYANPAHERRARAILTGALPGIPICISTDILAEFREYERASTVALNAYLLPVMETYLGSLTELLSDPADGLGLAEDVPVMVMEAAGGLMTVASAREKPVHTVLSGPAGGVVASAHVAALSGYADIIALDMGGTSTDISLVLDGRPLVTREAALDGIPVRIPVIDINAIGAGGGSIAWIDEGGGVHVGPASAGADPGPACYGRGGTRPTVTDCNVILGHVEPESFLGGDFKLDVAAAERAVKEHLADPLGISIVEAARSVRAIANALMAQAVRLVTVERGYDPRDFVYLAFGGAGPVHAVELARELQMPKVILPPMPGLFSAFGMLVADMLHDLQASIIKTLDELTPQDLAARFAELEDKAHALMRDADVDPGKVKFERRVDCCYLAQAETLQIPIPEGPIDQGTLDAVAKGFEHEHQRHWNFVQPDRPVRAVNIRLRVAGRIGHHITGKDAPRADAKPKAAGEAKIYLEGGFKTVPRYRRADLRPGDELKGPLVVEEPSTRLPIDVGDVLRVDNDRNLVVEVRR